MARQDGWMRVVVALDSFGGLMTARRAVELVAAGWHEVAPRDEIVPAPMSDGGPGLVEALAVVVRAAERQPVEVAGPTGQPVVGEVLRTGSTAYVESAQACGLDELRRLGGAVGLATTYGVGQLVAAAAGLDGVETVVVGLGGSGTNDGGAGLWAALGAEPAGLLRAGGAGLRALERVIAPPALGVQLVAATDVDNALLGLHGASAVYGPQKGADQAAVMTLDIALERWADLVEALVDRGRVRDLPGAGAAGGLGFGLLALGAERVSGIELVMRAAGLRERIEGADLVLTGEGRYDATSLRGKVPSGVADLAQAAGVPCVVVAGQSSVGAREASAHGVDEVWSVTELLGSVDAAIAAGEEGLRTLGQAVARAWSR
jgi:glycerate 2-kinase